MDEFTSPGGAAAAACCPFTCTAGQLSAMSGANVSFFGKVSSSPAPSSNGGSELSVQGSDGQVITVRFLNDAGARSPFIVGQMIEIRGQVQAVAPNVVVVAAHHTLLSENFDLQSFAGLVGHVHGKYRALFQ